MAFPLWLMTQMLWAGYILAQVVRSDAAYPNPCAEVGRVYELHSNDDYSELLDAEVAYECLSSVPIVQEDALALVTSLPGYLEFQSTLDYLASPPAGSLFPPVDIIEILDQIRDKVTNNEYSSEYDFQVDLHSMTLLGKDGHLSTKGPLLGALPFSRPEVLLISLSEDGIQNPSVYLFGDRYYYQEGENLLTLRSDGGFSAITKINGFDVQEFLQLESLTATLQDPDALYNVMVYPYTLFGFPAFYPGPYTHLTFSNGSSASIKNSASFEGNFTGIVDGEAMYKRFFEAAAPTEESGASAHAIRKRRRQTTAPAIPSDDAGAITGHWGDGLPVDVAVIAISSFAPSDDGGSDVNFQQTLRELLASATENGKKQLIIDLRMNGGGSVPLCIDTLVQLFPDTTPDTKSNMRASGALQAIIDYFSEQTKIAEDSHPKTDQDEEEITVEYISSPWAYQVVMSPDAKNFESVSHFYGPHHEGPGSFTSFFQENYTNNEYSSIHHTIMNITQAVPGKEWPFSPENIAILTDGICASSCSIFVEYLKAKFRVMSIVIGGRPQIGPMQTIGGVRGSRLFENTVFAQVRAAYQEQIEAHPESRDPKFDDWDDGPLNRFGSGLSVNGFNAYRMGEPHNTPLHFAYEAADCRIWYTPEMIDDRVLWSRIAELAFASRVGDVISSEYCVEGSTKNPTSISGGVKKGDLGPQTPPEAAFPHFSGWIVNGTTITQDNLGRAHGIGPVAGPGPDSGGNGAQVDPAALQTFKDMCADVTADSWFIKLMCLSVQ